MIGRSSFVCWIGRAGSAKYKKSVTVSDGRIHTTRTIKINSVKFQQVN